VDPRAQSFPRDPRDLDLAARLAWRNRMSDAQRDWMGRLTKLAEAAPASDFPAFLLATGSFAHLGARIATATSRANADAQTLDEMERFLDAFADYLRSDRNEAVFDQTTRRAG
jgi:hypothetical protein